MRARNIKPGIFKNEVLGTRDPLLTIIFEGLWCEADKEGRLEDRPLRLKAEILPYRENIDFNGYLTELSRLGFIQRYEVDNNPYIQVLNFKKHQNPHHTEKDSTIPPIEKAVSKTEVIPDNCPLTVISQVYHGVLTDPLLLIPDSLIPDSLIPDSTSQKNGGSGKKDFLSESSDSDHIQNFDQELIQFVTRFQETAIKEHGPSAPKLTKALIKNGCDTIDKLSRLDKFNRQDVFDALRWGYRDQFWRKQILSLANIRVKKGNGLMKFQNLYNKWRDTVEQPISRSLNEQPMPSAPSMNYKHDKYGRPIFED